MSDFNEIEFEGYPGCHILATSTGASWAFAIERLEALRQAFIRTKDERLFIELVRLLPRSYNVIYFSDSEGDL